jgi:adenosyl cobinamide kinase/adenosyl cobinamide phosphate guanylyltransferase/cobalamin synthase
LPSAPSDIKPNILHLAFDPRSSAIAEEVDRGHYDLVVVGAENRAIQHRLFFGYENERLIRGTRIPVVVVVPNLSRLGPERRMTTAARHRHLILVGGGARSGKSKFALARAAKLGKHRVFIATAERSDDEMRERIAKHRVDRRHAGFDTREEPRSLPEAVAAAKDYDVVVVDCLTVWIANLLVGGMPLAAVEKRIGALLWVLERHKVARHHRQQRGGNGPGSRYTAWPHLPGRHRVRAPAARAPRPGDLLRGHGRDAAASPGTGPAGRSMKALVAAFAFLTRLPVWRGPLRDADLGRSVSFFPLVGLVLGFALSGVAAVLAGQRRAWLVAALLAALLAGLTGGPSPGRARRRVRRSWRRAARSRRACSRSCATAASGAHGATALILLLIAKTAALAQVVERRDLLSLLAAPTIARWLAAVLVVLFPYARPDGLGRAFNGEAGRVQVAAATGIAAVVIGVLGPGLIPAGARRRGGRARVRVLAVQAARRVDRRRVRGGDRARRGRHAGALLRALTPSNSNSHFGDMLLRSPGMPGPAIVHIEFKSSDFARTSAFTPSCSTGRRSRTPPAAT